MPNSTKSKPKALNSLVLLAKKVSKITTAKFSQYQQHSRFPYFYWQISFMFSKATTISYQQYNSFPYFYGQMRLASSQLPNSSHINSTLKLHYSYWQNKISEVTTAHFCQLYHFQSVNRLYFKNSIIERSLFNRPYFLRHFYSKTFFLLKAHRRYINQTHTNQFWRRSDLDLYPKRFHNQYSSSIP